MEARGKSRLHNRHAHSYRDIELGRRITKARNEEKSPQNIRGKLLDGVQLHGVILMHRENACTREGSRDESRCPFYSSNWTFICFRDDGKLIFFLRSLKIVEKLSSFTDDINLWLVRERERRTSPHPPQNSTAAVLSMELSSPRETRTTTPFIFSILLLAQFIYCLQKSTHNLSW